MAAAASAASSPEPMPGGVLRSLQSVVFPETKQTAIRAFRVAGDMTEKGMCETLERLLRGMHLCVPPRIPVIAIATG